MSVSRFTRPTLNFEPRAHLASPRVAINFLNNDIQDLQFQSEKSYLQGIGGKIETFGGSGSRAGG